MIIAVIAGLIICRNRWLEMGRCSKKRPGHPRVGACSRHACPRIVVSDVLEIKKPARGGFWQYQ
jgi:hypothetical protein